MPVRNCHSANEPMYFDILDSRRVIDDGADTWSALLIPDEVRVSFMERAQN